MTHFCLETTSTPDIDIRHVRGKAVLNSGGHKNYCGDVIHWMPPYPIHASVINTASLFCSGFEFHFGCICALICKHSLLVYPLFVKCGQSGSLILE